MPSAICSNLDQSKILLSGNELRGQTALWEGEKMLVTGKAYFLRVGKLLHCLVKEKYLYKMLQHFLTKQSYILINPRWKASENIMRK